MDAADIAQGYEEKLLAGAWDRHRARTRYSDACPICRHCGGQIDPARLRVLPRASRCIDCQREMEVLTCR